MDVPKAMKGELAVSIKSEAVERSPLRSRFTGDVDLKITDPRGEKTYVRLLADLDGEYDGHPNEGLSAAIRQLLSALALPGHALNAKQSPRQTHGPEDQR